VKKAVPLRSEIKKEEKMKKEITVRELIEVLLDFNMEAKVKVNATGVPENFSLAWSSDGPDGEPDFDSRKTATELYFDLTLSEK
jgi:hypothetical protein